MRQPHEAVLELIATGAPIEVALRATLEMVERDLPGAMASILIAEGDQLRRGVAPSLPPGFNALIEGMRIAEGNGVCGTAAARGEAVIVHEVMTDPLVAEYRDLALAVGIRSAWSQPVVLENGETVATFAIYRREPHTPSDDERHCINVATRMVRILVERERAAKKSRDLDRQLRETLESISEALLVLDADWRVTYLNAEGARLLQRERSALLGRNVWEAFPEAVGGPFQQQYERARRENVSVHFEEYFGPLEGWFEIHAYPSAQGLAIYFRNVTARREASARMAEQAALLDIANDAILVRALDDKVLYWNKGAERIYGWKASEALGVSTRSLMNADVKEFDAAKAELLKNGEWSGTLRQVNRKGDRLVVECRWTLVRDEHGEPRQILAINSDVTERRALEVQFLRAQRLESIGTLAGGIAHDLNNVLAPVLMSLELLRELAGPRGADLIDSLEGNVKRGADLIRQVLTFARGLDGKREPMDAAMVLHDVARFARDTFPRSITIEGPPEGRVAMIVGDSTQLHQVVMNLAVNARDAMPNGGRLRLEIGERIVSEREAEVAQVPPGGYVEISVSDTGAGIPHDIQPVIFEPFYTTKEVGHGTGLGLSTVLSIVRSHGGSVHVVSEPGFGARFTCLLPVAPNAATEAPSARPRRSSPGAPVAGALVLVVDDERLIRVSAGHILERHGYRVHLAAHGGEAVEFVRSTTEPIAAMICDVAMPVMDGPATVAAVRQLRPELPIIVASGYMGDDGAQKLIGTGVEHFISKPFTAERLLSTLRTVLTVLVLWVSPVAAQSPGDWTHYGRDAGGSRYTPLTQIDTTNVARLTRAWEFRTGELGLRVENGSPPSLEVTPLHIDGTLFVSTPLGKVFALDPATGTVKWRFDPEVDPSRGYGDFTNRGVSAWLDSSVAVGTACRRRILLATIDARLIAIDATSGEPCRGFGSRGTVNLRRGLRIQPAEFSAYQQTSPPAVIGDLVIVGSSIADNSRINPASGEVRAFDARTGALRWTFDPVPQEDDSLSRTSWRGGSSARTGGANAWSVIATDPARGLVFVPTGSAAPDYYGGLRTGDNRYANSIVALRAATGEVVWHFQTVHHDLWDFDNASPPALAEAVRDGARIPVVLQATKTGMLFVLHRETGDPVFAVEEHSVPRSSVRGEEAWTTQPFTVATPPLVAHHFTAAEAWGPTDADRASCAAQLGALKGGDIFTPPSVEGTIVVPSNIGGAHWGGVAVDRLHDLAIVPVNRLVAMVQLIPEREFDADSARAISDRTGDQFTRMRGTRFVMRRRILRGPTGLPCSPPPFGSLVAVSLRSGAIVWDVPLGTLRLPDGSLGPSTWGSPNLGGPIVTAGGLVFIGASADRSFRAFEARTGRELWRADLPAGAKATPMTYEHRGRQYVVIAAGGGGFWGEGDALLAFALPETPR